MTGHALMPGGEAAAVAAFEPEQWAGPRPWYVVIHVRDGGIWAVPMAAPTFDRATVLARRNSALRPGVFEIWARRGKGVVHEASYQCGQLVRVGSAA